MRLYLSKILIPFLILIATPALQAAERADSYIIRAHSDHYKILAPAKQTKVLSIIIENKMLVNLVGRIETDKGRVITFVRIDAGKDKSISVNNYSSAEKIYFIPLSPAFQKIMLKIGEKTYEIPPKR